MCTALAATRLPLTVRSGNGVCGMKFAYEDLSPDQFEKLVTLICRRLLGAATQGFATGRDGGRDARFEGTAQLHPSTADPWKGKVIIQAKHTNGYNKSFSETEFFDKKGKTNTIIKEIPRIKALKRANELDHYMLFSNRKLTGGAETQIRSHIASECGIVSPSIYLVGIESLEIYMKEYPEIPAMADLDPLEYPLIVSPDELALVVEVLSQHAPAAVVEAHKAPVPRIDYATKNTVNNMSSDFAKTMRKRFLTETTLIDNFLSDPRNNQAIEQYQTAADEFQSEIISKRKEHQNFDSVINYLVRLLVDRDPVLRSNKRLTRAMVFYMYWNCDIGAEGDADSI